MLQKGCLYSEGELGLGSRIVMKTQPCGMRCVFALLFGSAPLFTGLLKLSSSYKSSFNKYGLRHIVKPYLLIIIINNVYMNSILQFCTSFASK